MNGRSERQAFWLAMIPVAVLVGVYLYYTLSNASYTLGCDYLAYDNAARRWLAGAAPYDLSITSTGDCGTYQYPPAFMLLVLPLLVLPAQVATWAWIALCIGMLVAAVALMPVPPTVRLITLALAGTSWPVLFAIKVGTTGPLLLLLFAIAWRSIDRALPLGITVAVGTLAKLQPGLLIVWMALTGRWRALATTLVGIGLIGGVWFVLDPQLWLDFLTTVRTISGNAIAVPANFAPASLALRYGVPVEAARAFGAVHTVLVVLLVVVAARRATADASLLLAAVASQVVSPVMWDHYAMVLFLPMAWLLAKGQRWVIVIGVALNAMFILLVPPVLYVVAIDVTMLALLWVGRRRDALVPEADPGTPAGQGIAPAQAQPG